MKKGTARILSSLGFVLLSSSAYAQDWTDWEISGSNTLRHDNIHNSGNNAASPYPLGGGHTYNEFDLNFSRNYSPYTRVSGQFFGVINESDYRHPDEGFVPERMNFQVLSGETAIPMRLDAGDYFANISYRTLQRSLKGAQLELQPGTALLGAEHSLLFFSGTNQPYWRHADFSEDRYEGASWLMGGNWGQLSLNSVHNHFEGLSGFTDQTQWVNSAAYATDFRLGTEKLELESELAWFSGDYGTGAGMQGKSDLGIFAELQGRSRYFTAADYRLRYENYGAHYQPRGAIITPNRESQEAFLGWRFDSGVYAQGRIQLFEDNADQGDEQDSFITGLRLTGPLLGRWMPDVSGSLHAYAQEVETQSGSVNLELETISFSLAKPLNETWNGEVLGFYQNQDNAANPSQDETIRQAGFRLNHNFDFQGFTGSVSPGLTIRDVDSANGDSVEIHPLIDVNLYKDAHSFTASYSFLNQNRYGAATVVDVGTQTAGLHYSYQWDIHEIGLEAFWYDRDVQTLQNTENARIGLYWTVNFHKPQGSGQFSNARYAVAENAASPLAETPLVADITLVENLALNQLASAQLLHPSLESLGGPVTIGRAHIFEAQLLEDFSERQRLALIEDSKGNVEKTVLMIESEGTGRPDRLAQTYARLRDSLIARYGTPDTVYEKGEFSNNLMQDVQTGQFVRVIEWHLPGSTLRFGLPRRTDGQMHFELQRAKSFSSPRNPNWSANIR